MQTQPSIIARRRWIFLLFLSALHLVFLQGPDTLPGRLMFLAHIGLGLVWQPFVQSRRRLGVAGTLLVVMSAVSFAFFLNWGLLLAWTMLLAGVVGGKVFIFPERGERYFHLLALGYLAAAVLALIVPQWLAATGLADPLLANAVRYGAPAVFAAMLLLPRRRERMDEYAEIIDYVYGVLVFLLLAAIVLGSISFALLYRVSYGESLLMTLALVSGILLLLGFIWDPRAGFGGLGSAVAQHVMSLGLPIEGWLESLSRLAREEEDPDRFMALACEDLPRRLPGIVGGRWSGPAATGTFGKQQGHCIAFGHGRLNLELFTRFSPGPALLWDYDLAARLLGEQYLAKWRAQELKRLTYIEAIHETGARLTHDVKNLLQTLETLCVAADREANVPSQNFHEMLRRQLPAITVRLRQALTKLAAPAAADPARPLPAATWFAELADRYAADWIRFSLTGDLTTCVIFEPTMFSSIAENLLQNAADKRLSSASLRVAVRLGCVPAGAWLEVEDDGTAMSGLLAEQLFAQRVPSENGLGIGLYHAARLAEQHGYRLQLAENRDGCVRFRLAPLGDD